MFTALAKTYRLFLFCSFCMCIVTARAQVPANVPTAGLLAYYAFSGNANNSYGSGNNGVVYGGVTYGKDRFGAYNSCYVGNGSSGIDIPANNFPSGNAVRSVAAWFKGVLPYPSTPAPYREIFATGSNVGMGRRFGLHTDGSYVGFESVGAMKGKSYTPDSAWHHLVVTYASSGAGFTSIKIYVDGVFASSTTLFSSLSSLNTDTGNIHHIGTLFMPAYTSGWLYSWIGSLDDIGVWNRELTACEVALLADPYFPCSPGLSTVTVGSTITWSLSSLSGGYWTSFGTGVATIGSSSGVVTGVGPGTVWLQYTLPSCSISWPVTVTSPCTTPGIITTIAGSGSSTYSGDGGPATSAGFGSVWAFAPDHLGNIYIAEYSSSRVRKVNTSGIVTTYAGNGTSGYSGDGSPATAAQISSNSVSIAADASGNVFVGDLGYYRIRKINSSGIITTIAGIGSGASFGDGGPATAAGIIPVILYADGGGNLYISENNRIRKINSSGIITRIAGTGATGFSGDGGPATAAMINNATFITVDNSGNVIFCDVVNHRIRKIDASGIISTIAGSGATGASAGGFSGDGGPATAAVLDHPNGVTFDSYGNMYIADYYNKRIRKVNTSGIISTFAGTGSAGFSGDGGPATAAIFSNALICLQKLQGRGIGVWDGTNYRLRKITLNNSAPYFINGASQSISVCANSGANDINSWLAVRDSDLYDSEVWSLLSGPSHGTASVSFVAGSAGASAVTPTGLTYTPATGYTGPDTFRVTVSDGCLSDTIAIYVTVAPASTATITGTLTVCAGSTTTLSCSSGGGWWSSGNTAVATVGSSTGVVSGVSVGTATIFYNFSSGCPATAWVTVNPAPIILGYYNVDIGSTSALLGTPTGGTWSSSNTAIATVGSTGIVAGVSAGVATITYTQGGCYSTKSVTVSVLTACPQIIMTIAGTGILGYSGDGGPATTANCAPMAMAIDAGGNIFFAEPNNSRIRKVTTTGIITTFAGTGTSSHSGDGGPATAATFRRPEGVAFDRSGNFYIADYLSNCVRKISPSGIISTIAGTGSTGFSGDGGPATAAQLFHPVGVELDSAGNIYIADETNNRIRKINIVGIITTIAGTGSGGFGGDGGPATAALLNNPTLMKMDVFGNLYFTDINNQRVRKINASGIITTIAGAGTAGFSGDGGPATAAQLNYPRDIGIDGWGNLYIADYFNNRIRKISSSGIITTVVGTGTSGFSGDGGPAVTAQIWLPWGIEFDGAGSMYFADWHNYRMRKVFNASNHAPSFTGGISQSLAVCKNSVANPINSLLAIIDTDLYDTETWNLAATPAHGTAVATYSTASTGGTVTPTGLYYTPTAGYLGNDTFKIRVTDCAGTSDTITVYVLINPLPSVITGTAIVCSGSTTTLADSVSGGTWSSSSTGIAGIGSSTGVVTGGSAGTATISYRLPTGCFTTRAVTVNPLPSFISGMLNICAGTSTTLYSATPGGMWASGATSVAVVGSSTGLVTGGASGTSTISYIMPTGCLTTAVMTVNPSPAAITGSPVVCVGFTSPLASATGGGFWISSNISVADVNVSTGVVMGLMAGTATITYTLPGTGCYTTLGVTVNTAPPAITGTGRVCTGLNEILYNGFTGGVWSSGATTTATVNPATGVYTGIAVGTAVITYSIGAGCYTFMIVTVNPSPAPIGGTLRVCTGSSTTLTTSSTGGLWSSSSTSTALIGSVTGMVVGGFAGTTTISYMALGCSATALFTVNPLPSAITGTVTACPATTTTLSSATTGGAWVSSATTTATIGSTTGIVTGVAPGISTITYTLPTTCSITRVVTINPNPTVIVGASTVCIGSNITLTNGTTGGTWSKSNANVNIGSTTGVVTGVTAGTSTITYALPTGCYSTKVITVNTTSGAIGGTLQVCAGSTTILSSSTTGGTWSSGAATTATINSTSGLVSGLAAGTAAITYATGTGCMSMATVTVHPLPAAITGATSICATATTTLSSATTGGVWSTTSSSATINSTTGMVTGIASGIATITYTALTSCSITRGITVNTTPAPITGPSAVCVSATIIQASTPPGGSWISSIPAVATIGATTGTVSGLATGTTTITYTLPTGCMATKIITVSSSPTPITGAATVCTGANTTLSDGVPGGWWSSSTTAVTIGSLTGYVTGVSAGPVTITYSLGTGCTVTRAMTVTSSPGAISGSSSLCTGTTTTLTNPTTGGTWSSPATTTATVNPTTGMTGGVTAGTATITYTLPTTGCTATKTITVNASPAAITGAGTVCSGQTTTLTNATAGGTWSTTAATATIGSTSGAVTGITAGTATITYAIGSCTATRTISINAIGAISGASGLCAGATMTLTNPTPGGNWSSGATTIVTVNSASGLVTGIAAGTATITYIIPATGCTATKMITVNTGPGTITGAGAVCQTQTTSLTTTSGGGIWTSSNPTIATINSTSGLVTGIATGTATITYSLGTGCTTTKAMTVNPQPGAISGASGLCVSSTIALTNPTAGGTWSCSSVTTATIGAATGLVSGITAGTATITYTIPATGCYSIKAITVNSGPSAITGTPAVCQAQTTTLTNTSGGGTWTSSNPTIATINSTSGIVTGIAAGISAITYSLGIGCTATKTVTVLALPSPITGTATLCTGNTTVLSSATTGGTWASSTITVATISSASGLVSGLTGGTTTITYTIPIAIGTGCSATRTVTVNLPPGSITGTTTLCAGSSVTLLNSTPGGSWSSSNPVVANIGSASGIVTGSTTGTVTITYATGVGCTATRTVTVTPPAASITGSHALCAGRTITLSHSTAGGTWSSSNPATGSINTTGVVTGLATGITTISYTISSGCAATKTITINGVPPVTGPGTLCAWGDTMIVYNSSPGGTYSSTLVTVTNLGGGYGRVTGYAPGIASVTYGITATGCTATKTITVNPLPANITGNRTLCPSGTSTLANTTTGGTWTSSTTTVATIGSTTGILSGIATGTARVTYTLATGCKTDTPVTVQSPPAIITGWGSTMITGTSAAYACATPGGIWSSSNTLIATIGSASGIVTGRAAGTVTITYSIPSAAGCFAIRTLTVTPLSGLKQGGNGNSTEQGSIAVYPNPNKGTFTISGTFNLITEGEEAWLQITDVHGRVVYTAHTTIYNSSIEENIQLNNIASGMYFVNINTAKEYLVLRIVIEK